MACGSPLQTCSDLASLFLGKNENQPSRSHARKFLANTKQVFIIFIVIPQCNNKLKVVIQHQLSSHKVRQINMHTASDKHTIQTVYTMKPMKPMKQESSLHVPGKVASGCT